ncbi:MAG: DUF922 domain-containing protein [Neorhizobium sp.]|jgi:predicted secreted Zn-dependent protease|nr:DUF922 domain-containing protein [Neorhizobium sp.]
MSSSPTLHRIFGAVFLLCAFPALASAEPVISKTYSYFRIGGRTADDLDRELDKRGPETHVEGHRHPGATQIKFGGDVTYVEKGNRCSIGGVRVTLRTKIILPRWANRNRATADLGFIWDTLAADIKRHEERHAEIARNHARRMERDLLALRPQADCDALEEKVADLTRDALAAHDADQLRFDQVEAANFDARMTRLLQYRMGQRDR